MRRYEIEFIELLDGLDQNEQGTVEFFVAEATLGNGEAALSNPIPFSTWVELVEKAEDDFERFTSAKKDESTQ